MIIKADIKDIEITTTSKREFKMNWRDLREIEKAIKILTEIQQDCSFDRIELEVQ